MPQIEKRKKREKNSNKACYWKLKEKEQQREMKVKKMV